MGSSEDFFKKSGGGESYPAIKFNEVGDYVIGEVITEPREVEREKVGEKGVMETQLPVNLLTGDGEKRTLWIRPGFMAGAVRDAVEATGATGLQIGGKLTVGLTELRDVNKPSLAKVFKAKYERPVSRGADVAGIFGDDAKSAPAAAQAAKPDPFADIS